MAREDIIGRKRDNDAVGADLRVRPDFSKDTPLLAIDTGCIHPHYPETDIGITLCPIPDNIGLLTTAIVTTGIPAAPFDDVPAIDIGG